jgi:hypothetical protein
VEPVEGESSSVSEWEYSVGLSFFDDARDVDASSEELFVGRTFVALKLSFSDPVGAESSGVSAWEDSGVGLSFFDDTRDVDVSSGESFVGKTVVVPKLSIPESATVDLLAFLECVKVVGVVFDDEPEARMPLLGPDSEMNPLSSGSSGLIPLFKASVGVLDRVGVSLGASSMTDLQNSVALSFKIGIVTSYPLIHSISV